MRTRVATIVTLLTLVVLGFLLVQNCSVIAQRENIYYKDELSLARQACGASFEGIAPDERLGMAATLLAGKGLSISYYSATEESTYTSGELLMQPTEEDFASARAGRAAVYAHSNAEGKEAFYAIYQFEDGDFLLISRECVTGLQVFLRSKQMIVTVAAALVLLVYLLIVLRSMDQKEKLAAQVMQTLDSFSDGKFDSRIEPIVGKSVDVGVYNAIIGRIQDRVVKQASRNNALNVVMNQMQNGIIAVDENLKVILVTPVAKKLLGMIGNPEGKSVTEASKDVKIDDVFVEAMRQGGVYTNEVAARTAERRGHRPLRLYVSPMRNDGKVVGALAMVEDITEIRRLEQVRTDFAANVSHELKTPLTSIRGFVETLENGAIDNPPMAHKFLRIIMLETERLTRLINDILSISKLESGSDEVTIERLRLDKMAFDVADMLSIHAGEKQVTIDCHMNSEPVNIMGNSDRVEQMLINLIENAIKYNKPGGSVTVQVFSNGEEANIAISDTGIGIAEENLPRLFERFYRVDKGRSRQMGGTGLGLAIVKHIVRSMNGEIEVHSKLGEGTEFLITLPLAPKSDPDRDNIFGDEG